MMETRESELVEFKKSTSEIKQATISLSAMLNKNSKATLYFGILNDGTVVGQQIGKDTTRQISIEIRNWIKPNIIPSINVIEIDNKQIIKVEVVGDNKPYSAYGRYYIRSDDEDVLMSNDILKDFFSNQQISYSQWENSDCGHGLDCINEELLINYFNKANDCGRLNYLYKDCQQALTKLGLFKQGVLNNAGYYLFSKDKPLKLKLATFNSDARLSYSDIRLFEGNIFECIEQGVSYLSEKMNWRANIVDLLRKERPEIPLEALREIVVNSFAHMKVTDALMHQIYLTPSQIVIRNPGCIYKQTDPLEFAKGNVGPILRNPLIAMTLYKNETIDSFATGFKRTFELCHSHNIDYEYLNNEDSFTFIFKRNTNVLKDDAEEYCVESRKESIVSILRKKPHSNRQQLAKELLISEATVARELKTLQELNVIKRIGSNKTGHWIVLEEK